MSKNLYVDFHVIQNVPPSCINRDDTGSPKTAMYGGTMRARVSSQAWKRAMRLKFEELFSSDYLGKRTRHIVDLIADEILKEHPNIDGEEAKKMAADILDLTKKKKSGEAKKSSKKKASNENEEMEENDKKGADKEVMFLLSNKQIESIARLAVEYHNDEEVRKDKKIKERVERALKEDPSIDILLFGRMAADNTKLNCDAAAQVAHSISTHAISNEYDYFTAVDEYENEENKGAGHLGTVEFNSSTLYRYATVNVRELAEKLKQDELKSAVRGFAEAFIRSMPTGRQNTFANRTLPDMVYVTLREDQPVNLAGAFEKPISAGTEGYVRKSEEALVRHAKDLYEKYAETPKKAWVIGETEEEFAEKVNLKELLEKIEREIGQYSAEGE